MYSFGTGELEKQKLKALLKNFTFFIQGIGLKPKQLNNRWKLVNNEKYCET